jgi:hypothetical protein
MKSAELLELSKLTNRELKNILRDNQIKNYSKLNKKNLVKKVNQFINKQSGGNSNRRNNKKYTLKELVGGSPKEGDGGLPKEGDGRLPKEGDGDGRLEDKNSKALSASQLSAPLPPQLSAPLPPQLSSRINNKEAIVSAQNLARTNAARTNNNNPVAIASAQNIAVNNRVAIAPQKGNNKNDCPACTIQ